MVCALEEIDNAMPIGNLVREGSLEKVMLELSCQGCIRIQEKGDDETFLLPVYLQMLKIFESFGSSVTI